MTLAHTINAIISIKGTLQGGKTGLFTYTKKHNDSGFGSGETHFTLQPAPKFIRFILLGINSTSLNRKYFFSYPVSLNSEIFLHSSYYGEDGGL